MSEKSFQSYFMKTVDHGYRTSLVNGGGFPDILVISGEKHFLVELKMLHIGVTGNRKLKSLFKPSQIPWYFKYLKKGGSNICVAFKLDKKYGLLKVCEDFCRNYDTIKYLDIKNNWEYNYSEYDTLKELINVNFS